MIDHQTMWFSGYRIFATNALLGLQSTIDVAKRFQKGLGLSKAAMEGISLQRKVVPCQFQWN
jgi:hypothetical protein